MTQYYVANGGNDGGPGTEAQPWETVTKVNASTFNPDDQVLFNRGDIWYGSNLIIPSSGTANHPIMFGAYGIGANPIIDASIRYTDWVIDAAAVWKRTHIYTPQHVFEDGVRLIHAANRGAMVQGSYYYDSVADLVYVWCSDDGNPNTDHNTAHPDFWRGCICLDNIQYVSFDSIDTKRSRQDGFDFASVDGCAHITVNNCTVSWHAGRGFDCAGGGIPAALNDIVFTNCTAYDTLGEGFWIGQLTDGVLEDCVVYNAGKDVFLKGYSGDGGGILVGIGAVDCRISDCHVYDIYEAYCLKTEWEIGGVTATRTIYERCLAEGHGEQITIYSMGIDTIWRNNIFVGSGWPIVCVDSPSSGEVFYYNTLIQNTTQKWGFYCIGSTDLILKNNIIYGNVADLWVMGIYAAGQPGTVIDNNCYYSTSAYTYHWEGGANWKHNLADWQTGSGQDTNSFVADPLFVTPGSDYHLRSTSLAINAAIDVGINTDYDNKSRPVGIGFDMGAFEFRADAGIVIHSFAIPSA